MTSWVSQLARDRMIEPSLLATRADIEALIRGDADARLARGWRSEMVGEPLRRLVAGEAALAFDKGQLVLEERSRPARRLDVADGRLWWSSRAQPVHWRLCESVKPGVGP